MKTETAKNKKTQEKQIRQKNPGKAKRLRFKGFGPKSGEPPNPQKGTKKNRKKNPKRPKSFFDNFGPLPAAASCPSGKTAPPSRHQPKQRKLQMLAWVIPSLKQSSLARLHGKAFYFCRSASVVSLFSSAGRACAS